MSTSKPKGCVLQGKEIISARNNLLSNEETFVESPNQDLQQLQKSNKRLYRRQYSLVDNLIMSLHTGMHTVFGASRTSQRTNPGDQEPEGVLSIQQKQHVAGLMRINHAGEVCAQALYQGQALTARVPEIRDEMAQAAAEEIDHLAWCEQRLISLNSYPSRLNPLWYSGSFLIGAVAGLMGDRWSLGFVMETERQVVKHLEKHLNCLPPQDNQSRKILLQMQEDEAHHATMALNAGAAELPKGIKNMMTFTSKIMTFTTYYL